MQFFRHAAVKLSFLVTAMASLTGGAAGAFAQTAPQLLPVKSVLVAGGGAALSGGLCPVSGKTPTDTYGDGCLATEIILGTAAATPGSRYAIADADGNVFFSDYSNGLIRRVDATTHIVTAVAGGATTTPAVGAACGSLASTDALGDGCLGTAVKLLKPMGLAFASNGDLYFSEADFATSTTGGAHVRRIAATNGKIPTTGTISLVLGQASNAKGYAANPSTCTTTATTTCITPTTSYLYAPYSLSFDAAGNLYVMDEYKEAVLVYNPSSTAVTLQGISIPGGTIGKILGSSSSAGSDCPNAPATTNGCSYGTTTFNVQATATYIDNPYAAAPDAKGNVYFANEYYNYIGKVSSTGLLTDFAGIADSTGSAAARTTAGTTVIGSPFGVATDANSNVYFSDASLGAILRVDADTLSQYVIAGAGTVCATATDTYGDGCPATQTTFGLSGTTYASTTLPGPGVYGLTVDTYGNVYAGDTETNLVREISTGAQFGVLTSNATTNTLTIHFGVNDGPATSTPYVISTGSANFAVGTPGTCVTNSDNTKDCPVPVTATLPTTPQTFTGALTVTSAAGKSTVFPLSGIYVASPTTTTTLAVTGGDTCSTSSAYSSSTTLTITATVSAAGTATGTVQFYNNKVAFGSPVQLSSSNTATISQTFPAGSYSFTATYAGDTSFNTSTSVTALAFSTADTSFSVAADPNITAQSTVTAGQTALYGLVLSTTSYSGNISLVCSGLPAGASCVFSPAVVAATRCATSYNVSLGIITSPNPTTLSSLGGRRSWMMLVGAGLALLVGLRRRKLGAGFGTVAMLLAMLIATSGLTACSSKISDKSVPTTSGTYTVTVTAAGSPTVSLGTQTTTVTLTVK
ncbi:MAG: Ig-like domain repeat protein [Acidobacteriaceae bacterium]|nr:Ig-like domain repeat protein [Acidobacteriaceae bacterium]